MDAAISHANVLQTNNFLRLLTREIPMPILIVQSACIRPEEKPRIIAHKSETDSTFLIKIKVFSKIAKPRPMDIARWNKRSRLSQNTTAVNSSGSAFRISSQTGVFVCNNKWRVINRLSFAFCGQMRIPRLFSSV